MQPARTLLLSSTLLAFQAPTHPDESVTCDFRHNHLTSNSEMTDILAAMKDKE